MLQRAGLLRNRLAGYRPLVDLVWQNTTTGQIGIWHLSGLKVRAYADVDWTAPAPWHVISR